MTVYEERLAEGAYKREAQFENDLKMYAQSQGWLVRSIADSRRQFKGRLYGDPWTTGLPDCLFWRGGVHFVAELKVGRNKATADQRKVLEAYVNAGLEAYVWYPSDWCTIREVLD